MGQGARYVATKTYENDDPDEAPSNGVGGSKGKLVMLTFLLSAMLAAMGGYAYVERERVVTLQRQVDDALLELDTVSTENENEAQELVEEVAQESDLLAKEEDEVNKKAFALARKEEDLDEKKKGLLEEEANLLLDEEEFAEQQAKVEQEKSDTEYALKQAEKLFSTVGEMQQESEEAVEEMIEDLLATNDTDSIVTPSDQAPDSAFSWKCSNYMKRRGWVIQPKQRDYSINLLGRPIPKRECPAKEDSYMYDLPADNRCFNMSMWFLKGPKVGGATMAGVNRRISNRQQLGCVGCSIMQSVRRKGPRQISNHGTKREYLEAEASKGDVFKWTVFRHPVQRCISNFFFHMVRVKRIPPTEQNLVTYARNKCRNTLTEYYLLDCKDTADALDFIGLTERSDDTLLALAHVLDLPIADIMYAAASKKANQGEGIYITKNGSIDTNKMEHLKRFFNSSRWQQNNVNDLMWWNKANSRLDSIIQKVGKQKFDKQLEEYRYHREIIGKHCSKSDLCYWGNDNGCGFPCMDHYAHHHNLYTSVADPRWEKVKSDPNWKPLNEYSKDGFEEG